MKYFIYCLIGISFLLNISFCSAMQKSDLHCTIFGKSIQQDNSSAAIICRENDSLIMVNLFKYCALNYNTHEIIEEKEALLRYTEKICFHHDQNMVFYFHTDGAFLFHFDKYQGKNFYRNQYKITTGVFSKIDPLLCMGSENNLILFNYKKDTTEAIPLENSIDVIFSCPSKKADFFMYWNQLKNTIYKIVKRKNEYAEEEIVSLPKYFSFDQNNVIYNDTGSLLYLINNVNRRLHIFNIKNGKSRVYPDNECFPIAAMMIHPNKTILTLLSQNKNCIEYLDIKSFDTIHSVFFSKHESLNEKEFNAAHDHKMAFSQDGNHLFIAIGNTIYDVYIPFSVNNQNYFEIFKLLYYLPLPLDLQKLLSVYVLFIRNKEYKS